MTMTLVREFSRCGPCIRLGELTKRTVATIYYRNTVTGEPGRRGGRAVARGLVHTEPCRSCRDHPETMYPDGYMD